MSNYLVRIEGHNYILEVEGDPQILGFYRNLLIEASSEEVACQEALATVRDDPKYSETLLNGKTNPPYLTVDEVSLVDGDHDPNVGGYIFFPAEEP